MALLARLADEMRLQASLAMTEGATLLGGGMKAAALPTVVAVVRGDVVGSRTPFSPMFRSVQR